MRAILKWLSMQSRDRKVGRVPRARGQAGVQEGFAQSHVRKSWEALLTEGALGRDDVALTWSLRQQSSLLALSSFGDKPWTPRLQILDPASPSGQAKKLCHVRR